MYGWLIITGITLFLELNNPGLLFFFALSCGSFGAAIVSLLGYSANIQCAVGSIIGIVMLVLLKTWVKRQEHQILLRSNVDALIGKKCFVIKTITPMEFGQVKVGGEIWSAKAVHDLPISAGAVAQVVQVVGVHLVVQECEKNN